MADPKILLVDVETSPLIGYAWAVYDTNLISVIEPTKVICCAWKWLGDQDVTVKCLADYSDYVAGVCSDEALIKEVWKVLDEADVVVAHNGDGFDIKVLNARFVASGFVAPSSYTSVDTLKVAKKYFKFTANSLNELGKYLDLGTKTDTGGFSTWTGCMSGDPKAWDKMKKYNKRDIEILERVYLRLRPYMSNHPNLNVISNSSEQACSVCQNKDIIKRGFSVTKAGRYQRYSCQKCGSWTSGLYERLKVT